MRKNGKVGIYIRLSLADEDTGHSKMESDSIGTQRMLINRFLDSSPELAQRERLEFVDESGILGPSQKVLKKEAFF